MRLIMVLVLCVFELHAASKTSIQTDNADYDGKQIHMVGAVHIQHEFGNLTCDKGVLVMKEKGQSRLDPDRIFLYGSVAVVLHDGSILTSEEADINCETLEGVFTATPPNKVVYVTRVEEGDKAVPVKTISRCMRVTMKRQSGQAAGQKSQYVIQDVQAEGAVQIEYQQEHEKESP